MSKYADLHLHSMDLFDSDNRPERVCERMKELGAKGFALTQHGVLSGIDNMRDACESYGLKFIPGIETYYGEEEDLRQNQHLILLSKNYIGYRAIWKAVSDSQNLDGKSVMNADVLQKYFGKGTEGHGNVVATSACIQGVLAAVLRSNDTINDDIAKFQARLDAMNVDITRLGALKATIDSLNDSLAAETENKKSYKKMADMRLAKAEKYVEKLKVSNNPAYEQEFNELEAKKAAKEQAAKDLVECDARITKINLQLSTYKAEYKSVEEKANRYLSTKKSIDSLNARKRSEEDIYKDTVKEAEALRETFGDGNFYIEIQNHGIDKEAEIYPTLVKIARELHIPLVATNDVHTVTNDEEELLRRQIMRSMRFGKEWEPANVGDDQLYIKTDEELTEWLLKIFPEDVVSEAMGNIKVIFDSCEVEFPEETHYPKFPLRPGETINQRLISEIKKGIAWRFPEGLDKAHSDRLNHEYQIIKKMGYQDYHLIVKDFLEYGRALGPVPTEYIDEAPLNIAELKAWTEKNGWRTGFTIGPGRGSGVGSLICYCLGITNLDPLKYDLLFEREKVAL